MFKLSDICVTPSDKVNVTTTVVLKPVLSFKSTIGKQVNVRETGSKLNQSGSATCAETITQE